MVVFKVPIILNFGVNMDDNNWKQFFTKMLWVQRSYRMRYHTTYLCIFIEIIFSKPRNTINKIPAKKIHALTS